MPDFSIEVDDVNELHRRALKTMIEIVYSLTDEPWCARRLYLRDPLGRALHGLSQPWDGQGGDAGWPVVASGSLRKVG